MKVYATAIRINFANHSEDFGAPVGIARAKISIKAKPNIVAIPAEYKILLRPNFLDSHG